MAKKARQRISYVLENAKSTVGGHRLGVNGLAVDPINGVLFSGGRDGVVCAWDLSLDSLPTATQDGASKDQPKTTSKLRSQTQAHMHWINDIALAQTNTAVVSASSDLTVKVWRPYSEEDASRVHTIGEHADYVKCVATPPADMNANWVASGGLDRKVCLWDLSGKGKTLEMDVKGEEVVEKGSIYSLSVGHNLIASGGPEKTIKLHDPRTGSRVSKLVGHVDNIRSILMDDSGDTILSASGDKTIKMWSVKGGRCMYTFTMHDESVWSLFSDDPRLGIFYSSDRSGLVVKTDVRGSLEEMDDGLSLALAQEHSGVNRVVAARGHFWTSTNQSSINRWEDLDLDSGVQLPEAFRHQRPASHRPSVSSALSTADKKREIPAASILRISTTAVFPSRTTYDPDSNTTTETMTRKGSEAAADQADPEIKPIHHLPQETIQGQFGLLKHKLLNDRRRVLTLDTAGDVLLWDLIKCKPIKSFGKQHIEDVELEVNTKEAVAPWCSVDLSSGNLTVVLEPFNCFDAEVYADDLELDEPIDFREDQRISLGRWILRYLFSNLIDEEIKRDEAYRSKLNDEVAQRQRITRANAPTSIALPQADMSHFEPSESVTTPKANGAQLPPTTPGMAIGLATPGSAPPLPANAPALPGTPTTKQETNASRASADRDDYFSSSISAEAAKGAATATTPAEATDKDKDKEKDKEKDKDKAGENGKAQGTTFGKKFRMSFGTKKLGRSASQATQDKPTVPDEKAEESESSSNHEREVEDSFLGVIQKLRNEYDRQVIDSPDKMVETRLMPSLPTDTPVLKLPEGTKVIIQEETTGGSANLYQGTVSTVGLDADVIESKAPMWLGDVLLQNHIPFKDPVKVSFVLHPMDGLPAISVTDGNNRLNANRMLRVKKILGYVSERIEPAKEWQASELKAEEYLELYCNDQLLSPMMSLATLRTHFWKGGSDIVLYYKANGRKEIKPLPPPQPVVPAAAPAVPAAQGEEGEDAEKSAAAEGAASPRVSEMKAM